MAWFDGSLSQSPEASRRGEARRKRDALLFVSRLPTLRLHHAVLIEWAARGNPVLTWPGKPAQSHGSLIQFRCCQRCRGSCIQQVWPFFSSQQGAVSCSVQAKLSFLGSGGYTQTPSMLMQNWRTMCWPVGRFVACVAHPMSIMHIFPKIAGPIPVDPRMSMDVLMQEGFSWEECCGAMGRPFRLHFWIRMCAYGPRKSVTRFPWHDQYHVCPYGSRRASMKRVFVSLRVFIFIM